jgi:hypothetical protein
MKLWATLLIGGWMLGTACAAETQERPVIRVLLETLHHQSRLIPGRNFSQTMMAQVLKEQGAEVEESHRVLERAEELTEAEFSAYDLVVMNGRYSGKREPDAFSPEVLKALDNYVISGGYLLVISGGSGLGAGVSLPFYNPLMSRYGVEVLPGPGRTGRALTPTLQDQEHPLVRDIEALYPCHGTTLKLTNREAVPLAFLDKEPCLAVVPRGFGWVIILGGGSGWMDQGMDPAIITNKGQTERMEANQKLIRNLVDWLQLLKQSQMRGR